MNHTYHQRSGLLGQNRKRMQRKGWKGIWKGIWKRWKGIWKGMKPSKLILQLRTSVISYVQPPPEVSIIINFSVARKSMCGISSCRTAKLAECTKRIND